MAKAQYTYRTSSTTPEEVIDALEIGVEKAGSFPKFLEKLVTEHVAAHGGVDTFDSYAANKALQVIPAQSSNKEIDDKIEELRKELLAALLCQEPNRSGTSNSSVELNNLETVDQIIAGVQSIQDKLEELNKHHNEKISLHDKINKLRDGQNIQSQNIEHIIQKINKSTNDIQYTMNKVLEHINTIYAKLNNININESQQDTNVNIHNTELDGEVLETKTDKWIVQPSYDEQYLTKNFTEENIKVLEDIFDFSDDFYDEPEQNNIVTDVTDEMQASTNERTNRHDTFKLDEDTILGLEELL